MSGGIVPAQDVRHQVVAHAGHQRRKVAGPAHLLAGRPRREPALPSGLPFLEATRRAASASSRPATFQACPGTSWAHASLAARSGARRPARIQPGHRVQEGRGDLSGLRHILEPHLEDPEVDHVQVFQHLPRAALGPDLGRLHGKQVQERLQLGDRGAREQQEGVDVPLLERPREDVQRERLEVLHHLVHEDAPVLRRDLGLRLPPQQVGIALLQCLHRLAVPGVGRAIELAGLHRPLEEHQEVVGRAHAATLSKDSGHQGHFRT